MAAAVLLRDDFDGIALRRLAKATKVAGQARRLLALSEICDGGSRSDAARIGGVGLQTIRDWVLRFNARGPAGLIDGKAPGNASKLDDTQRQALAAIVESDPIPAIHEVVRWRRADLAQWIWEEFGISLSETTVGREVKALGFIKISARPRHYAQNALAIADLENISGRAGGDPRRPPGRDRDRAVVSRRSSCGPEERHHPPLGQARRAAPCPA